MGIKAIGSNSPAAPANPQTVLPPRVPKRRDRLPSPNRSLARCHRPQETPSPTTLAWTLPLCLRYNTTTVLKLKGLVIDGLQRRFAPSSWSPTTFGSSDCPRPARKLDIGTIDVDDFQSEARAFIKKTRPSSKRSRNTVRRSSSRYPDEPVFVRQRHGRLALEKTAVMDDFTKIALKSLQRALELNPEPYRCLRNAHRDGPRGIVVIARRSWCKRSAARFETLAT